jgi:hypothetical protein
VVKGVVHLSEVLVREREITHQKRVLVTSTVLRGAVAELVDRGIVSQRLNEDRGAARPEDANDLALEYGSGVLEEAGPVVLAVLVFEELKLQILARAAELAARLARDTVSSLVGVLEPPTGGGEQLRSSMVSRRA